MRKAMLYMLCMLVMMTGIVEVSTANAAEPMKLTGEGLFPPNAKAGECYAKVFTPPTYKTISETALKKDASEKLIVQAPKFELVDEQVMTKAPSERFEIVPATYEWIEEKGLASLESSGMENAGMENGSAVKLEVGPPTYEWIEEQMISYPGTCTL